MIPNFVAGLFSILPILVLPLLGVDPPEDAGGSGSQVGEGSELEIPGLPGRAPRGSPIRSPCIEGSTGKKTFLTQDDFCSAPARRAGLLRERGHLRALPRLSLSAARRRYKPLTFEGALLFLASANRPARPSPTRPRASEAQIVTNLYLIRHGEALVNVNHIVGGMRGDTGLTQLGVLQAERLRDRLAATREIPADVLIASTYRRAQQTAEIVAPALGLPVTLDDEVQELRPGEADGMPVGEAMVRYAIDFEREPYRPASPGGETGLSSCCGSRSPSIASPVSTRGGRSSSSPTAASSTSRSSTSSG